MHLKKIRGWKRRLRQLEVWKNDCVSLDIDFLRDYEVEYKKIFNFDEEYVIPNWFKRSYDLVFL